MLRQSDKDRLGTIASVNGDIGIDKVGQARTRCSISRAHRDFDGPPLLNPSRFWHATQSSHRVFQAVAGWKDCDDVAKPGDFQIDVGIGIGQLSRNANGLAVAGFEDAGARHRNEFGFAGVRHGVSKDAR